MQLTGSGLPCPICTGNTLAPLDNAYIRCLFCGVIRTQHSYDATLYQENYAQTYIEYASNPQLNIPLNLFRLGLVSRWLRPGDSLLDIGCCIGEFIRFAERYYRCTGFEPNKVAAKMARSRVLYSKILETLDSPPEVQCITMFDVIEHLENPIDVLKSIVATSLTGGGVLVVGTPDADSVSFSPPDDSHLRAWKHWKPKEHLWLHTEESLTKIAEMLDLRVLSIGREENDIRPGNEEGGLLTVVMRKEKT